MVSKRKENSYAREVGNMHSERSLADLGSHVSGIVHECPGLSRVSWGLCRPLWVSVMRSCCFQLAGPHFSVRLPCHLPSPSALLLWMTHTTPGETKPRSISWQCRGKPQGAGRAATTGHSVSGLLMGLSCLSSDPHGQHRVPIPQAGGGGGGWFRGLWDHPPKVLSPLSPAPAPPCSPLQVTPLPGVCPSYS